MFNFSSSSVISICIGLLINILSCLVDVKPSSDISISSYSFSPGLSPVISIGMSTFGSYPNSFIKLTAKSYIFTGSPISSTNISPPFAYVTACNISCTASGIVIKNLVISLCVTVTGPPLSICFLNSGITDPLLPNTLPNLTATYSVLLTLFLACTIISQTLLLAPIMFVGFTALSVEINTNFSTPYSSAQFTTLYVPNTLLCIASNGLFSISGTCLCAAA